MELAYKDYNSIKFYFGSFHFANLVIAFVFGVHQLISKR